MVARKTAGKKTAAGDESTEKAAPGKAVGEDGADGGNRADEAVTGEKATKATAKKGVTKRNAGKKTAAGKKAAAKKSADGSPARKATTKKAAAKKAAAPAEAAAAEPTARKAEKAPAKKAAKKAAPAEADAAKTTGAQTVAAKKTPVAKAEKVPTARAASGTPVPPGELAVRPGEDPWTPEEVEEARTGLGTEAERLKSEIAASEEALNGLMRDSGDGAGDDDADTGTKNITREHEMSLAANAREMLYQTERALERLDAGTYGLCENCGNPIGKARMQAFPRATLCVECKQKQERR
ncbi:TraR/DksA family transcriptional regulator [Streptomyces daliensis]|uniref:TraR/DksA C4-type zinc finger protein n=1 Tax=Streptomyces daliensis TaxID=299421 RepID=A0A8T4IJZ2_9ACTN|nr:TraR/DksA C4-type zinc finger protein [Streptomyces daliensis]